MATEVSDFLCVFEQGDEIAYQGSADSDELLVHVISGDAVSKERGPADAV